MHDSDRDRPCTDRLDEETRPAAPPRPPAPRWRVALHTTAAIALAAAAVVHGVHWVTAMPGEIPSIARAVTAVLWAALLVDLVMDRLIVVAVRAIRADIAAHDQHRGEQLKDLTAQVQMLADAVTQMRDEVGERIDTERLRGTQQALDELGGAVLPMPGRLPSPRRTAASEGRNGRPKEV